MENNFKPKPEKIIPRLSLTTTLKPDLNFNPDYQIEMPTNFMKPNLPKDFEMQLLSMEEVFLKDTDSFQNISRIPSPDEAFGQDFSTDFFKDLNKFGDQLPFVDTNDLKALENVSNLEANDKTISVYRITTDGETPFDKELDSKIIYDSQGEPSEVVVFEEGQMAESKVLPTVIAR